MKKKVAIEFSEGPTPERRQHGPFARDVLTPAGAPIVARHRARMILTPLAVRRAILEDVAQKPEIARLRSLRRRLTALDRALSDREAEALERLTSCLNSLSNVGCLNYLKSEIRSSPYGRLPFGEAKRREIAAMNFVMKALEPGKRALIVDLAGLLDPSPRPVQRKIGEQFVLEVQAAAQSVVALYEEWETKTSRRPPQTRQQSPSMFR